MFYKCEFFHKNNYKIRNLGVIWRFLNTLNQTAKYIDSQAPYKSAKAKIPSIKIYRVIG